MNKEKKLKEKPKEKKTQARQLKGVIISTKMQKTVVVAVSNFVEHSKYRKRYKKTKKHKAHDEEEKYEKGDRVIIQEIRPISKDKTWKVIGFVQNYEAKPK